MLVIFSPFNWFDQKKWFSSNQIFPQNLPLFKLVEKNKFPSNS